MRYATSHNRSPKTCVECGKDYQGTKAQKYCSDRCGGRNERKRKGRLAEQRQVECARCGVKFETGDKRHLYCSAACRTRDYNDKWLGINVTDLKLSSSTVGAISELKVTIDLLSRGYEVFRALSPACSCDLAILKDGELLRVEVTTAYKSLSGNIQSCKKITSDRYDVLAYVLRKTDEILYEPHLP